MRFSSVRRLGYVSAVVMVVSSAALGLSGSAAATTHSRSLTPSSTSTFLFTTPITVTTTTHKRLSFSTHALSTSFGGTPFLTSLTVGIDRASVEDHDWSFEASANTLNANATSGTGSLDSGSQLGAFGSLSLKISSAGAAKKTTCGANKTTIHPVKVSGPVDFVTGSTGSNAWGSVDRTLTFKGMLSTSTDNNVTGKCTSPNACPTAGVSYVGIPTNGTPGIVGLQEGRTNLLTVTHTTSLSSPSGATRSDIVYAAATVTASHSSKGEKLTIKPKHSKPVSGSAYFLQKAAPKKSTCKKIVSENYEKAKLTSKSLEGHEQVFGTMKVGSFANLANFEIDKKK